MTVAELIEHLSSFPQHLPVAYRCCSEQVMLDAEDIEIADLCFLRPDGWVANKRPDKPTTPYVIFPGN